MIFFGIGIQRFHSSVSDSIQYIESKTVLAIKLYRKHFNFIPHNFDDPSTRTVQLAALKEKLHPRGEARLVRMILSRLIPRAGTKKINSLAQGFGLFIIISFNLYGEGARVRRQLKLDV